VLAAPVIRKPPMDKSQMVSGSTWRWVAHRYAMEAENTTRNDNLILMSWV